MQLSNKGISESNKKCQLKNVVSQAQKKPWMETLMGSINQLLFHKHLQDSQKLKIDL